MNEKQPAPSTLRLKEITFQTTPRLAALRSGAMSSLDLDNPHPSLVGWSVTVRGSALVFTSPRGWKTNNATSPHLRDKNGPVVIVEIPRGEAYLTWTGDPSDVENVLKSGRYDSGPIGLKPVVADDTAPLLAQIPAGQMGDA